MRIRIATITPDSPAHASGLRSGDEIERLAGVAPRDVLDYSRLAAGPGAVVELADGRRLPAAALAGAALDDAVFDGVATCDNHCEFCFVHQLPAGLRRPLYLKDDDYRLSAMYGNFTTLTRFTEADLERVVEERIGPLHVSIHATDPYLRATMLRNPRGATSLRWLRAILDAGIAVHGQIVCCPGVNDGQVLEDTLADLRAGYPELASVGIVPLGVSRHNTEAGLRATTPAEAGRLLDTVARHQDAALAERGRRFVFASDEYHLLAGRPFPQADAYEGFPQLENGIGMAASLAADLDALLAGRGAGVPGPARAVAAPPWGYRAERGTSVGGGAALAAAPSGARTAVVTGELGARVIRPLLERLGAGVDVLAVGNRFFGGNVAVTGLLAGADVARAAAGTSRGTDVVLPDVVLHEGRTLDEWTPEAIAAAAERPLRVVTTDAAGLLAAAGRKR